MPDTTIASETVVVLGGIETLDLQVDFGPAGTRGSNIFRGTSVPNDTTVTTLSAQIFDLYINTATRDLYQLVSYPGGTNNMRWEKLFSMIPNLYSNKDVVTFVAGTAETLIPVVDIAPDAVGLLSENLAIQHNIISSTIVSSSISVGDIYIDGSGNLQVPVTIKAVELVDGEWTPVSSAKTVDWLITVV